MMTRKPLAGMRVAIVGTFTLYQYEVKELIQEAGGEVVDYINASTSLLVVGQRPESANNDLWIGTRKQEYARIHKVKIVDEIGLEEILKEAFEPGEEQIKQERLTEDNGYGAW